MLISFTPDKGFTWGHLLNSHNSQLSLRSFTLTAFSTFNFSIFVRSFNLTAMNSQTTIPEFFNCKLTTPKFKLPTDIKNLVFSFTKPTIEYEIKAGNPVYGLTYRYTLHETAYDYRISRWTARSWVLLHDRTSGEGSTSPTSENLWPTPNIYRYMIMFGWFRHRKEALDRCQSIIKFNDVDWANVYRYDSRYLGDRTYKNGFWVVLGEEFDYQNLCVLGEE